MIHEKMLAHIAQNATLVGFFGNPLRIAPMQHGEIGGTPTRCCHAIYRRMSVTRQTSHDGGGGMFMARYSMAIYSTGYGSSVAAADELFNYLHGSRTDGWDKCVVSIGSDDIDGGFFICPIDLDFFYRS